MRLFLQALDEPEDGNLRCSFDRASLGIGRLAFEDGEDAPAHGVVKGESRCKTIGASVQVVVSIG
ncbi:MAG: hypothetical protein V2I43_18410, partial [Parvularcula sp.]|nr:hypothetical protein [Parvularcula sp.]